jgi:ubiquinol-cytochrome c reductase cytochrome b subunit
MRYRPLAQQAFVLFALAAIGLGFCGANDPDKFVFKFGPDKLALVYTDPATSKPVREISDDYNKLIAKKATLPGAARTEASIEVSSEGFKWLWLSQILGFYYFDYFLLILPALGVLEKPKVRPASIADSVRKKHSAPPTPASGAIPVAAE